MVKGRYADLVNAPRRARPARSPAAQFLARFAGDVPWAHLDIAGVADDAGRPWAAKGGTGWGVAPAGRARDGAGGAGRRSGGLTRAPGRARVVATAPRAAEGPEDAVPVRRADAVAVRVVLEVVAHVQLAQAPAGGRRRHAVVQVVVQLVVDEVARPGSRPSPRSRRRGRRPTGTAGRSASASGTDAAGGMTSRLGSFGWSWWTPWMRKCSRAPTPPSGSKWKTMRCSQYSVSVHST